MTNPIWPYLDMHNNNTFQHHNYFILRFVNGGIIILIHQYHHIIQQTNLSIHISSLYINNSIMMDFHKICRMFATWQNIASSWAATVTPHARLMDLQHKTVLHLHQVQLLNHRTMTGYLHPWNTSWSPWGWPYETTLFYMLNIQMTIWYDGYWMNDGF